MVAWPSEHLNNSGLVLRAIAFSLLVCGVLKQMTKFYFVLLLLLAVYLHQSVLGIFGPVACTNLYTLERDIIQNPARLTLLQISPPDWLDLDFLGSLNSFSVSSPSSLMQHHPQSVDSDLSKPCVEQTKAKLGLKRGAETVEK